jgi:hypothetical protein
LRWFSRHLWLTLGMFAAFSAAFVVYALSERQIDRANEARQRSGRRSASTRMRRRGWIWRSPKA